jgi:hypothetical protein
LESSATKLTEAPVRLIRRLRAVIVKPAATSVSSASFFAPFTGSASSMLTSTGAPSIATRRRAMSTYIGSRS